MVRRLENGLSKRERQIMEAVYGRRRASAREVLEAIPDPPGYSAVRATLGILVRKGLLSYRKDGRRYVYAPRIPHEKARQSAVRQLLKTYFDNSVAQAVSGLITADGSRLRDDEYDELINLIIKARKKEKKK